MVSLVILALFNRNTPLLSKEGGKEGGGYISLFQQLFRVSGHGTILRADIGTDLDGTLVSLFHRSAVEDSGTERTRKRVAGTDGISHRHLRCFLEGCQARCEDV